jgi:phage gp36-like protein
MPYVTKTDLTARYGEDQLIALTDRANVGAINDTVLDAAIADAGAEIDAHLMARYDLPLGEVPPLLSRIAAKLVFHSLHTLDVPDAVKDGAVWARATLKEIGQGRIQLTDGDGDGAAPAQTGAMPVAIGGATEFTDGGLSAFVRIVR